MVQVSGSDPHSPVIHDEPAEVPGEAALLAEEALAADWNRPEEDAAWAHLAPSARDAVR